MLSRLPHVDLGDAIALYAALAATGTAAFTWHTWRRAPRSRVDVRDLRVRRDGDRLEVSVIAANRSPHEVELVAGTLRLRAMNYEPGEHERVVVGEEKTSGGSVGFRVGPFALETSVSGDSIVTLVIETPLAPASGTLPVAVKAGQGTTLRASVPLRTVMAERATAEVRNQRWTHVQWRRGSQLTGVVLRLRAMAMDELQQATA
jgi:hypothetical protein